MSASARTVGWLSFFGMYTVFCVISDWLIFPLGIFDSNKHYNVVCCLLDDSEPTEGNYFCMLSESVAYLTIKNIWRYSVSLYKTLGLTMFVCIFVCLYVYSE